MYSVGVESPPDIYTTAIGFYVLWILGKAGTAIIMKSKDGLLVVTKQLILWLYQVIPLVYVCVCIVCACMCTWSIESCVSSIKKLTLKLN